MSGVEFEPGGLFKSWQTAKGQTLSDGKVRVSTLTFSSRWSGFLRSDDQTIETNTTFPYLLIEPENGVYIGCTDIIVVTHGLNEGSPAKLFPWAYNLSLRLQLPTLVFPMAFHVSRRSAEWGFSSQARLANERSQLHGNRKTSPFNALISSRLSHYPDRFLRGGLQSYYDVLDLADLIRSGRHPGCREGARLHFLGYSAGGYLALALLLANPGARFSDSRAALFASCAPVDGLIPDSIFIMDTEASSRLHAHFGRRCVALESVDPQLGALVETPQHWLDQIFYSGQEMAEKLSLIKPRLMAIGCPNDRVITATGMAANLIDVPLLSLDLGIHEFPFNLPDPLIDAYDRRQEPTRTLLGSVGSGYQIAPPYREAFQSFVDAVSVFLTP